MWVVILTLHRILTEFKPIIAVKFSNSTWKINTHSVSVNYYFHFSSLILHYSSYKAFLCLLLFPSYNDSSRQGLRNSKSSSEYSLWRKNIKIKTQGLGQWVWQMLRHSTRNEKRVHQLSSSPNKKNQVLRLKSICLLLYCHRCGEDQKLRVWLHGLLNDGALVPEIISRDSSIKTHSGNYCLLFPVFFFFVIFSKGTKRYVNKTPLRILISFWLVKTNCHTVNVSLLQNVLSSPSLFYR